MMNKSNSIEAIDRTDLSEQTKFRLDEVSKIENYFHDEINQRKSCNKKLSKYVAVFDYIDKILIVLSATTWSVGAPVGIASASFPLIFFSNNRNRQKRIKLNKKKKHDKNLILAKSKLNSTGTLISQALIDMEIIHEEFAIILKENDKYEKIRESLRSENKK